MRYLTPLVLLAGSAFAQNAPAPSFEVASIKINQEFRQNDTSTWRQKVDSPPGSLTMRNVSLLTLLKWAYHVERYQVSGPGWLDSERYDVLAKAPGQAKEDEMRLMLQTLLAERFKLALHRERRTLPVLAIVEDKGGHKMKVSASETPESKEDATGQTTTRGASLAEMAGDLSSARDLNAAVVDRTGLKGRFDFQINIKKYVPAPVPGGPPPDVIAILQEALQKELGLRLESRKESIEVLVIDHVEKSPVEN